jgi:mannose-6-phosphate isomerase-like protein (cupin superfamily)
MDKISQEILKELLPVEKEVVPPPASAKAPRRSPIDHWSPAVLLERAHYLRKMAAYGDGSASETLKEYPGHCAMLSFRSRDGEAEVHQNFADMFYVLDGRATMVTGGTVTGARTVAPGEMRGASIEGGARQEMKAGDLVHVPACLPHQMLVAGDKTITCFVVKIPEIQ